MGFLIPLGIKINFLFYPWSAQSRRGQELPAWEKICRLRYTTKYQAKLMYGNWLLLHLPSRSHLHADTFHWQQGGRSQRKVFFWVSNGSDKTEAGKRRDTLRMPTCHEITWMALHCSGWEGRSEQASEENSVTWDRTASDYLQYHRYTCIWL